MLIADILQIRKERTSSVAALTRANIGNKKRDNMVHFNYDIGDKIKLSKPASFHNLSYDHKQFDPEKIYTIDGFGWEDTDGCPVPYYRVETHLDEYLTYHNELKESDIVHVGEQHPHDIDTDFYSTDKSLIKIGDMIYYHLYRNRDEANTRFIFAGYGPVVEMSCFYEKGKSYSEKRVTYKREFLCKTDDGRDWFDARMYGGKHTELLSGITKNVPDDYAELYVKTILKNNESYILEDVPFDVKSWLEHISIYDKVMGLYNEKKKIKTERKNPMAKGKKSDKKSKLEKMISILSESEKEELKKMLC